jgi:curved DNA-binding protein
MVKNYYQILNIEKTSSTDEIKKAYRRLASIHHPDKGGSTVQFQLIEEAYRTLSDPVLKAKYDNSSNFSFQNSGFNIHDLHNIFNRTRNSIHRAQITLTLEEVYSGVSKNIKLDFGNTSQYASIEIPHGVTNTTILRYDDLFPNHQLIAHFSVINHPNFNRIDHNLFYDHNISIFDLILGTEFTIKSISKVDISIKVPPQTNPNTQLRIQKYGMKIFNSDHYGDLFVNLIPFMPQNINDNIINAISMYK